MLPVDSPTQQSYTDPAADVVLVSKEGREFRVKKYFLQAASTFFRQLFDQLDDAEDTGHICHQPIPVEATSFDLEIYLDFVTQGHSPILQNYTLNLDHIERLLALSDSFNSITISKQILTQVSDMGVAEKPWEMFVISSKYSSIALAKLALSNMSKMYDAGSYTHHQITVDRARLLSLPYLLGYMKATAEVGRIVGGREFGEYDNWPEIAAEFKPCS